MTTHITAGREQWLEARRDLLAAEKDLDAAQRRGGAPAPAPAVGQDRQGL